MNRPLSVSHRKVNFAALLAAITSIAAVGTPLLADAPLPADAPPATDATTTDAPAAPPADTAWSSSEGVTRANPQGQRAASLIDEAIAVAYHHPEARVALARGAAALLPQLDGRARQGLTNRWVALVSTDAVPREVRLSAYSSFFDVSARTSAIEDMDFARDVALMLPDPAARAGAFIRLSEAAEKTDWNSAAEYGSLAQRAARQEEDLATRARALAYISTHLASLNPATREAAVVEASSQARLVQNAALRDALLAEIVGAAAKFDVGLAQRVATGIEGVDKKNFATARIAAAQVQSSFAVRKPDPDKVATIVNGVPRYDTSFIPILLQLPATPEVFQALGDALPPIYPDAPISVEASTLERIWSFASKAEPSVYRDQLQSRVARLMVLHDLWRGREWGRQLAWQGGRNQIARFVNSTVAARESALQSEQLRTTALADVNRAILSARRLPPTERVEGLLLIAGQVMI